jgi:hypothetical protein
MCDTALVPMMLRGLILFLTRVVDDKQGIVGLTIPDNRTTTDDGEYPHHEQEGTSHDVSTTVRGVGDTIQALDRTRFFTNAFNRVPGSLYRPQFFKCVNVVFVNNQLITGIRIKTWNMAYDIKQAG